MAIKIDGDTMVNDNGVDLKTLKELITDTNNLKEIKPITFSNWTNKVTDKNYVYGYRLGRIGIISFCAGIKNISSWTENEICTMNVSSYGATFIFGVIIHQNSGKPINLMTKANSNKLFIQPYENGFTEERWYRGQIIFLIA